ncbi:MAG: hypothetical protein EXQ81_05105 [Thermoleophilia bacterium]|nr:hypothetical protein [Thermoleophilia bacterium]
MRLLALILLGLTVSAGMATGAERPSAGSFELEGGRGSIQIIGKGAVVGRIEQGALKIIDLSPADQWSPFVNGVPRGKVVWLRGRNISFRISAGRYQIMARGEGISVSARGMGVVVLEGDPGTGGDTGLYHVGDAQPTSLPGTPTRMPFGRGERGLPSSPPVKMK